jgi:hypothetical protein
MLSRRRDLGAKFPRNWIELFSVKLEQGRDAIGVERAALGIVGVYACAASLPCLSRKSVPLRAAPDLPFCRALLGPEVQSYLRLAPEAVRAAAPSRPS